MEQPASPPATHLIRCAATVSGARWRWLSITPMRPRKQLKHKPSVLPGFVAPHLVAPRPLPLPLVEPPIKGRRQLNCNCHLRPLARSLCRFPLDAIYPATIPPPPKTTRYRSATSIASRLKDDANALYPSPAFPYQAAAGWRGLAGRGLPSPGYPRPRRSPGRSFLAG